MNLSKSKYCQAVQCKKILWLDKYKREVKEEIDNKSVLENGTNVGELAKRLFGKYVDIEYNSDLNKMISDTKEALKEKNTIITEASFVYDNNFCSVDILKKENDEYMMYEVKSSTHVSDIYLEDISYQYYVLTSLGMNVKKAFIIYINSDYVRNGDLELDKLFITKDVTEIVESKKREVEANIKETKEFLSNKSEPNIDIGSHCFSPYDCPLFKYCSRNLPEKNVFDLKGLNLNKKVEFYNNGIVSYEDLINSNLADKYKDVIDFELNGKKDKVNKKMIKNFLDTLSYPIYHLDFESYQEAIPSYDGIRPYMQIPFQYSLHIEDKNGNIEHKEFLASGTGDSRRELALKLINDIPKNSCILAYNMAFEKSIIKYLASLYDDLSEHLMNIYDNIRDLMIPFKNRDYYSKEMHGSYSIKYVLPALYPDDPDLDYHNLDMVHNGSEASDSYFKLSMLEGKELEELRENMLKYCELDTYAMVKVLEKLKDSIK